MIRPTNIYPCNGRERMTRPYMVQDGYHEFDQNGQRVRGKPRYIEITTDFSPGCKYDSSTGDPKCQGCGHRNASTET